MGGIQIRWRQGESRPLPSFISRSKWIFLPCSIRRKLPRAREIRLGETPICSLRRFPTHLCHDSWRPIISRPQEVLNLRPEASLDFVDWKSISGATGVDCEYSWTGAIRVVHQDRRTAREYIVRVACGRSLPAFSLVSGYITVRRGVPMCAGVRGCCRHYCRQRSSPLGKSEPPRRLSID
jgi:hypothetical protein